MPNSITLDNIDLFLKNLKNDEKLKIARNAAIRNQITEVSINWDQFKKIDHTFSNFIKDEMPATNQKSSGRCWGFAGLNLFRLYLGRKHKLKDFQFSQSYFMFWDKLEKANYFLESILNTSNKPSNSRIVMHLLSNPIQDGGQWDMWVNLINKYGVVPQSVMPETYHTSKSGRMNRMITRKLREYAKDLREAKNNGASEEDLKELKHQMLEIIFRLLTIHIGAPPSCFDWQIKNKNNEFQRFEKINPVDFYKSHVGLNLNEYVCLINCPMPDKNYNKVYTVEFLGNVIEGEPIRYLNVDSIVMKQAAIKSIQNEEPVWFGCDVGKHLHRDLGVMDMDLFDFDLFYSTKFNLNKSERLEYGDSAMTHAMLFTGVDLDSKGNSNKWRVENSWGNKNGDKGYYIMTDKWFDEYTYEVVVHKSYLPDKMFEIYSESKMIPLKPWDPMGALAR